jgi:hypothetical protein
MGRMLLPILLAASDAVPRQPRMHAVRLEYRATVQDGSADAKRPGLWDPLPHEERPAEVAKYLRPDRAFGPTARSTPNRDEPAPQASRQPDLDAQRAAMKKLAFLAGKWAGEARSYQPSGDPQVRIQTEEAQYKLDGLMLTIEGVARTKSDGKMVLQAFGIVSYDDQTPTYRMRAFNDGRFLEIEVKLAPDGKGMTWGFALGDFRTQALLRINERESGPSSTRSSSVPNPPERSWK